MSAPDLTAKELFHFALYASKMNRIDDSVIYLKQFLELEPNNADALFLMGSHYAELSLFEEGIEFMRQALTYAPEAHLIRFQMSMLHFSLNQAEQCRTELAPLLEISEDNPFYHFAHGITFLMDKDEATSISSLKKGLEFELNNPSLQQNIEKMIGMLEKRDTEKSESDSEDSNAGEMFLSVYKH